MATRPGMSARLLVVDSDKRYGEWLRHHLGVLCPDASVSTLSYRDFERSVEELPQDAMEVVLLSASFGSSPEDPRAVGLEILRRLRELDRLPVLIAVAEEGNELTAVRAMQLGAVDYLPKRLLTPDRLKTAVRLALRRIEKRVARRIARLARAAAAHPLEAKSKSPELEHAQGEATSGAAPAAPEAGSAADRGPTGASPSAASANVPGGDFMSADFIPGYTIHA